MADATAGGRYRLAPHTVIEPLVNRWIPWADLISPVPYSLHLTNYQCEVLASYLEEPEVHARAAADATLASGPFAAIPAERVADVAEHHARTLADQADNIAFARALMDFENALADSARGESLDERYRELPAPLRGYVELVYDYFDHPLVRCLEGPLYDSPYYRPDVQSFRVFAQRRDDARPFFLNTPRLPSEEALELEAPFAAATVDELARLDLEPQPLGHIRELLGATNGDGNRLAGLLTTEPVPAAQPWRGPGLRLRYFGHACVLAEWDGGCIMTDPWVAVRPSDGGIERSSYDDLPRRIDVAVVTHGHHDHFVLETLLRLRHRIGCLVVPRTYGLLHADTSLKLAATRLGFPNVVEMEPTDELDLDGAKIVAVPFFGEHADLAHGKAGYVLRAAGHRVLFAADSNCLDPDVYTHLRTTLGDIDTVYLGMESVGAPLSWLYGAYLPRKPARKIDQSRRTKGCDAHTAIELIRAVGACRMYVYAMGREPWLEYAMGIGSDEDTPQVVMARRAIRMALDDAGLEDAQLLFGRAELHLPLI